MRNWFRIEDNRHRPGQDQVFPEPRQRVLLRKGLVHLDPGAFGHPVDKGGDPPLRVFPENGSHVVHPEPVDVLDVETDLSKSARARHQIQQAYALTAAAPSGDARMIWRPDQPG